ncbi:MAG: HNH endonuclease [Limisphaerales bacterium]
MSLGGPNPQEGEAVPVPSSDRCYSDFQGNRVQLSEGQIAMLKAHFETPDRALTARQLAEAARYPTPNSANLQYGMLGRLLREELPFDGLGQQSYLLVYFRKPEGGEWQWNLHFSVVVASDQFQCGWFTENALPGTQTTNEADSEHFVEGAATQVLINTFERDSRARGACLSHHGTACSACGLQLGDAYGPVAAGYIHVHHLDQLANVAQAHEVDPLADLRPVCLNCQSIIHLRNPAFTVEEIREMLLMERKGNAAQTR